MTETILGQAILFEFTASLITLIFGIFFVVIIFAGKRSYLSESIVQSVSKDDVANQLFHNRAPMVKESLLIERYKLKDSA